MYVFDNAALEAAARLEALAAVFDPGTIRHLEARGVAQGWRCLEVGGGRGTMTQWLAARVGPSGYVLATDIDPRHLGQVRSENVEVARHDVVHDDLPEHAFDLAYTRLVLSHLTDPTRALANIARAVKSGGWIVVEDFGVTQTIDGDVDATLPAVRAMRRVIAAAGVRMEMGWTLPGRLRAAGLEDVTAEGRTLLWSGGSAGAALMRLNMQQLRDPILTSGMVTAGEYDRDLERLASDPTVEVRSPTLWTVWGKRPHGMHA